MAKYTTVKEMSAEVNKLYALLADAKMLTNMLAQQNLWNHGLICAEDDAALAEERPLTLEQRKTEAKNQWRSFERIYNRLTELEVMIGRSY